MDKAASPSTLRQDVLNVIWNGYPYFAGSWKGVDRDFAAIGQNSGLSGAVVEQLNNIAVTQQAIWALTDSRPGAGNTQSYVNALIAASQKNPAPANFGLDLYDGSARQEHHSRQEDDKSRRCVGSAAEACEHQAQPSLAG